MINILIEIWNKVWPIIIAIVFFGFIIFIHELGHFLAARFSGVKINEFAIGMGPTLFKIQGKETKYAIRLLPVGGFVSMEGEDEDSNHERAFNNQPIWQRIIIVVAGAFMNIVLGLVLMGIITSSTPYIATSTISEFAENSISQTSGLEVGDKILKINGMSILTHYDLSVAMMRDTDGKMDFLVKRNNEKVELKNVTFKTHEEDGQVFTIADFYVKPADKNFFSVASYSAKSTFSVARMVWISLGDLISGKFGMNDLSGPVGTVAIVGESASTAFTSKIDFMALIMMMALITINVGVFNLLPLPALDGGRLVFLIIELIARKPINRKYEYAINAIGFILLIGFIVVVTFSDINKLVG